MTGLDVYFQYLKTIAPQMNEIVEDNDLGYICLATTEVGEFCITTSFGDRETLIRFLRDVATQIETDPTIFHQPIIPEIIQ